MNEQTITLAEPFPQQAEAVGSCVELQGTVYRLLGISADRCELTVEPYV